MPRRIAILLPDLRIGGVEHVHVLLSGEFLRRGYIVEFVLMQASGELLARLPAGVGVVDLGAPRFRNAVLPLLNYLWSTRPDMLLAAMWPLTGMAALAKRLSGSDGRLVVSETNYLPRTPAYRGWSKAVHRRFGKRLYGLSDAVVCVSEGVRESLIAAAGLCPGRIHVVHNPVRPVNHSLTADTSILAGWRDGVASLIAVGTLKEQKDYPTMLRAMAILRRERDARLLILGEGELRGELEELAKSLGISEHLTMPGFVSDPYPYLMQADLFVLSSAWEGFGNVIVEALVARVPVVATDCPSGPAEILEDGRYGRLVPVGDPAALAGAMAEVLDAPSDPDMLRRRGGEFSVERAADRYLALLDPDAR